MYPPISSSKRSHADEEIFKMKLFRPSRLTLAAVLLAAIAGAGSLGAADDANLPAIRPDSGTAAAPSSNVELDRLRALLASQQKQLEALQKVLDQQQKLLEQAAEPVSPQQSLRPGLGTVASIAPVIPVPTPVVAALPVISPAAKTSATGRNNPCEAAPDMNSVPPYLRFGSTCIIPIGFMDLTGVWRDKNTGTGIASSYAGVPYNNVTAGKLSEFRFSPQNSRLGFRADGDWKGTHFIGYNEIDFLGTSGTNNLGVTNGAFVPRIRLFWAEVRKGKWEFLGGQSWSLLTPNRRGLSPLPGDLFYSMVADANYMAGLTWSRQPGARVVYHASKTVTAGLSLENPNQYMGGSAGLSATAVTLPAATALSTLGGTQVDNATNVMNTPNLVPDIIAKIAFDPGTRFHFEAGGLARTFRIWDSATNTYSTKEGAGVLVGANVEVARNFRLITTNFWSDGGGRYLFGQAPDFIVRANGSVSPIHAGGTVDGFEAAFDKWLLYAYYGALYIERNTALDANGTTNIGYGYVNSSNSDNKAIQELTFGYNHTVWKDPRYGAINLLGQYEWLTRDPWAVLPGAPKAAHDSAVFMGFRYTLPGTMPNF